MAEVTRWSSTAAIILRSMFKRLLLLCLLGCKTQPTETQKDPSAFTAEKVTTEDSAMGTHLSFAAYTNEHVPEAAVRRAFADAIEEIRRVEALMTTWHPSDITRINDAAGGAPVPVSSETFDIVKEALHAAAISKGTFDITFESLHGLWKFDQDLDPHPPSATDVRAKLPLVDYHHVKLDETAHTVSLDTQGVRIGLGGIAKGYAVDRAAAVLDRAGITSYFVQAGGDLFTRGKKIKVPAETELTFRLDRTLVLRPGS